MANLFWPQTDELCYITVEDVKDSLPSPISDLSDAEIEVLIVKAQNELNIYLNSINPDIPCEGFTAITEKGSTCWCSESYTCEYIPIDIKRATLQIVDNVYSSENSVGGSSGYVNGRRVKREQTACGVEVEYEYDDSDSTGGSCTLVDCNTQNMLLCYEKRAWNISLGWKPCGCGFKNSFNCINGICDKYQRRTYNNNYCNCD